MDSVNVDIDSAAPEIDAEQKAIDRAVKDDQDGGGGDEIDYDNNMEQEKQGKTAVNAALNRNIQDESTISPDSILDRINNISFPAYLKDLTRKRIKAYLLHKVLHYTQENALNTSNIAIYSKGNQFQAILNDKQVKIFVEELMRSWNIKKRRSGLTQQALLAALQDIRDDPDATREQRLKAIEQQSRILAGVVEGFDADRPIVVVTGARRSRL